MSDQLRETAAEIAALIPKYSWEIMDEEQRDALMSEVVLPRYMSTTADGVQTGPTFWAEMVGATAEAIRKRVQRLRESQSPAQTDRTRALSPSSERHVKSGLRKAPELITEMVEELHDNPAFQAAVASASSRIEAKREQRTEERVRVERGISEAEMEFERLRRDMRDGNYGDAERRLQAMEVDEVVTAYMRQQGARFKYLMDWANAWGAAEPISDEQLQEWLA